MLRKVISLILVASVTTSYFAVKTSANEKDGLNKERIEIPRYFNIVDVPNTIMDGTTLKEAILEGSGKDLVIHNETTNKATSYSSSNALRQGNLNNLVIYTKFKGEDEFLSKQYKGNEIKNVLDNMYNTSNISVNNYYDKLTQNKLDLQTKFLGSNENGTLSIELDHERGYYMPYSDDNKIGYCKYTVIDENTYEYIADLYYADVPDTDPSDGIVTQHYLEVDSSVTAVENPYIALYREQKLMYEIAKKANSTGITNVNIDKNRDDFIDAATVLIGVTPDNEISSQIEWGELLWPHQTSMAYGVPKDEIENINYIFNLDFSFLNEAGSEINGKTISKYNLYTSDFLLDEAYDIESDKGKVGSVGVICHELAHILDLPDLYSYKDQDLACVGQWDLMEYTGVVPQFVNSYLRKEAGWLNDNQMPVVDADGEYELKAISNIGSSDIAGYIIKVPENQNQFFFVEYRKDEGDFDGATAKVNGNTIKNIYESGLVIYRVDTSVENSYNFLIPGNFEAPPYNIYTFRDANQSYPYDYAYSAINGVDETTYGSIEPNVMTNALTFQDSQGNILGNSRVVIDNVNVSADKIKFTVDAKDPSAKTVEIVDNKILVSFDEKINSKSNLNLISLLKDGNEQDINIEVVEENKVAISLKNGELSGQYIVNIPKEAIKDIVGKTMVNDFTKSVDAGEEEVVIDVTDVMLDQSEVTLKVGNTMQLNATVKPENATNKNVAWESDNTEVVTVDNNGKITALKAGQANITVTTEDGNKSATCKVTVVEEQVGNDTILVESVVLDKAEVVLNIGEDTQLNATVNPENATNKNVIWTSSDETVAKVDENGKVKAIGSGEAIVTVTTIDGAKTATCNIKVKEPVIPVAGVNLDKSLIALKVGENVQLNATVCPENATNKNVVWTSNNESVAIVDETGKVTAVSVGEANITVTSIDGNKTAACRVVITAEQSEETTTVEVTGIELDKTDVTIKEGDILQLTATVKPENATNKNVIWTSANPDIATVDANGKVVAVKEGEVVITARAEAGEYMAICKVKVEKKAINSKPETKPNETTKTETVTTKPQTTKPGKGTLPQTGKETPMVAIGVIVLLGGVLLTIKSKKISKNYIN